MPEAQIRFFLYRCVLNACRNHLKHESRKNRVTAAVLSEMRLEELDFAEANLDKVFDEFMLNKVYKQIGALPPKCREIFEMSYLHQKKTMKIAEELGISRRTVETQLYKALKFLRGTLLISIVLIFI